jgi:hypothetical protein
VRIWTQAKVKNEKGSWNLFSTLEAVNALLRGGYWLECKYARELRGGGDIAAPQRSADIVKFVRVLYRQVRRPFRLVDEKLNVHLGNVFAFVHEFDSMLLAHLCLFAW